LNDLGSAPTLQRVDERRFEAVSRRAAIHAALGDPIRLAIVDELRRSDRAPSDLASILGIGPPLLSFHLATLEQVGLVRRVRSAGDRRRRYVQLVDVQLVDVQLVGAVSAHTELPGTTPDRPVTFVCTHNSARSQLAAALWRTILDRPARSAGTEPADVVHPGAIAAARRDDLDLDGARPTLYRPTVGDFVVTVCDRAHEQIRGGTELRSGWHWSLPDPAIDGTDAAFDDTVAALRRRISGLGAASRPGPSIAPPEPDSPTPKRK
jgi:protein-tyrosine-phosphatase/DNA-binding HxlR family transcriptional regulator